MSPKPVAEPQAMPAASGDQEVRASCGSQNPPTSAAPGKALVIADDIGVFLSVARSLGRAGIAVDVATCAEDYPGLASRFVAQVHCLPPYLTTPEAWVKAAEHLIETGGYELVYACSDSGLGMLNAIGGGVERTRLIVPNPTAFCAFTDKAKTRELAGTVEVSIAAGRTLCAGPEALSIIAEDQMPMVVKCSSPYQFGSAESKAKARIVRSRAELAAAMEDFCGRPVVVEQVFEGDGVGVSVLAKAGNIRAIWQHRRNACADETGRSSKRAGEAVDKSLLADVTKLVEASDLTGVAMFEFIQNAATQKHILLEVNPRYWGSLALAVAAGADFPFWHWQIITGHDDEREQAAVEFCVRTASNPHAIKANLEAEYDRLSDKMQRGDKIATIAWQMADTLRAACLQPARFDSWTKDDPAPHWREVRQILARIGTAMARRLRPG